MKTITYTPIQPFYDELPCCGRKTVDIDCFALLPFSYLSPAMEHVNLHLIVNCYRGSIHPGLDFGNCSPVRIEHIRIENKITLNQQKRLINDSSCKPSEE